jgi:signal peptidase I
LTAAAAAPARGATAARGNGVWRELPLLVGLALLLSFLVKTFVAQAFFIPSESMVPQLDVGDRVVVSKLAYHLHDPRRGDILVLDAPPGEAPVRVKDTAPVPVRWLKSFFEAVGLRQPSTEEFIKRVIGLPGDKVEAHLGRVFVNGRQLLEPYLEPSVVTTDFGPVTVPPGTLFMMGDNRERSKDSRSFGAIPRKTVVGRAFVRAWPPWRTAFL